MNVLSLFSGIGGLELGLERADMTVVGQVEIDPYCRRVLAKHWPEVPRHDDVRTAVEWWHSEPRPPVDVICGGFPCQDISVAGRRAGIYGDRSGLWFAMSDVVRALRPRYVVMENVAALLVRGLDVVAADLATSGYDLQWDCIPAAAVGAPHRRDRWFGIAYPQCDGVRLEPVTQSGGDSQAVAVADGPPQPVADATSNGRGQGWQGRSAGAGADRKGLAPEELADADGSGSQGRWLPGPASERGSGVANTEGIGLDGRRGGLLRSSQRGERNDQPGGSGQDVADYDRVGRVGRAGGLGSRGWPQPAHSDRWATEPDVGRVAHGVPSRVDRLRGLGNAVVPQVSEYVGRLVMEHARAVAA